MILVVLPGFASEAAQYAAAAEGLADDLRLMNLPGHAGEPLPATYDLAALADWVAARVPRDALVVGESLGGLIALELATRGFRAVAFEPPLSTAKLWTLHDAVTERLGRNPGVSWLAPYVEAVFGVSPNREIIERDRWGLLDRLPAPTDIVAGDVPLGPRRRLKDGEPIPTVLDDADGARLARHPNVRFRRIAGPHGLLSQSPETSRPMLAELIAQLG